MRRLKLKLPKLSQKTLIIAGSVLLVCGVGAMTFALTRPPKVANQTPTANNKTVAKQADEKLAQETQTPAETTQQPAQGSQTPGNSSSAPRATTPVPAIPPSTAPGPYPYRVTYVSLDQPTSYCAGSGQEAIILYDARLSLSNSEGGEVKYGFDVTGAANPWGSYQQPLPIPAGKTYYTINELRGMSPSTIFNMTVAVPHDTISVRVVIYSPNSTASSWFTVPARDYGYCP